MSNPLNSSEAVTALFNSLKTVIGKHTHKVVLEARVEALSDVIENAHDLSERDTNNLKSEIKYCLDLIAELKSNTEAN